MKVSVDFPKVRINARELSQGKLVSFAKAELLNTLARLRSQIGMGKGADGQPIKAGGYSEHYKKLIRAGQVRGGTRGTGVGKSESPVNLTLTGDLLGSIQVRGVQNGSEMFFLGNHYSGQSNAALAASLIEKGFDGWFEYGKPDVERIESALNKMVDEALQKLIETK